MNHHLRQLDNIDMAKRLQELDFAHCGDRESITFGLHSDPLESDMGASNIIPSLIHFAKGPLANLTDDAVYLVFGNVRRKFSRWDIFDWLGWRGHRAVPTTR